MKKALFNAAYEVGLWGLALAALPKVLYELAVYGKHRKSLLSKLGVRFPAMQKKNSPLIWIHAVSVGETKAVTALAKQLKNLCPEHRLVISTTTETGYQEAKRSMPFADRHVFMPLDLNFIVKKVLAKTRPDLVILSETDFWYNFLRHAKCFGAKTIVVNGKLSERSEKRLAKASFFSKRLLALIDLFCVQNNLYRSRFLNLGVPGDRLVVTGNIKFDDEYPQLSKEELMQWKLRLGIHAGQPVLTIGSTHHPEEKLFLKILERVWKKRPDLKVLMVPRHPERFKEVAQILEKAGISFAKFSDGCEKKGCEKVILIDAMGILRICYQLSDLAIVAGSYTQKVGGHNVLEPSWYGVPVLFGPHMHTQTELVDLIHEYKAGVQADESVLEEQLEMLLENEEKKCKLGRAGLKLIADLKGGTKRTLQAIFSKAEIR